MKHAESQSQANQTQEEETNLLESNKNQTPESQIYISKTMRYSLYVLLILCSVIVNLDHGTIPAATREIRRDFDVNIRTVGFFGSMTYLGTGFAALALATMFSFINIKLTLTLAMLLHGIFLLTFTFVHSTVYLNISRFLVGMAQACISIYLPVWINQYGIKKNKTIMMSVFNASSPIGLILGYLLTFHIKEINVRLLILVENLLLYPVRDEPAGIPSPASLPERAFFEFSDSGKQAGRPRDPDGREYGSHTGGRPGRVLFP